ncbi:MAG: sce7725 family protein [Bacteroidota bacterium]|nr:sce7725 family protein [Bacteroidota bacterium]
MYYPYLRGKQFELLALREFAEKYSDDCKVFPIIEPVKSSFNSMKIALKKLNEKNVPYALILNPQNGDLIGKAETILNELDELLSDTDKWTPAYIVNTNAKGIINHIQTKGYQQVMLICQDSVDSNNQDFKELLEMPEVKKVIFVDNNRSFKRELGRLRKEIIRIDDNFKPQKRNSDYCDIAEEKFSEEVFYYREDGFDGFTDYTVLSSTYIEGGMLPYALAIHLTYRKNDKEVWVRHFVSVTNDDNTNIHKKFREAVEKAVTFFESIPYSNESIAELTGYFRRDQYPGLGVLKKISIKNHLELMNSILSQ